MKIIKEKRNHLTGQERNFNLLDKITKMKINNLSCNLTDDRMD